MVEHVFDISILVIVACVAYFAGSRGWLGKW